ncbi:MAG: carbamoylphosphate synthase large subunit [Bacilli bacterium]|nr:carbamoylphosphate synthase large subunit [Bacilli bacterium]
MQNFIWISPHFPETYYQFTKALKSVGFRVLGIGDCPYENLSNEVKNSLDDYATVYNMEDVNNTIHAVEYLQSKYGHIDYLESNNEYWLHNDAILRERFNISTGVFPKELETWQRKSMMKERFIKSGVSCSKWINPIDRESIVNFAKEVGFPMFIKPDIGVGAYGNFKIENENDIDNFLNNRIPGVDYICEQYITGNIVSFDGICDENSEVVFMTSHFFPPSVADVVKEGKEFTYWTLKEVPEDLKEAGTKIVKAFGLKKRCFHFEFFRLTKDIPGVGKKGEIAALECNMRTPGGYTPDMIDFANSVNFYDLYAQVMMNNKILNNPSFPHYFCSCSSRRDGKIYKYSDEDVLNKYKNFICMSGRFPDVLAGDMGNRYFIAKFDSYSDMIEFNEYVGLK